MVRPNFAKWEQSPQDILKLSVEAAHTRSRERFQALYMIGTGQTNATQWSQQIGRQDVTVLNWVHTYNTQGPAGLQYRRSGGRPPLLT